MLFNSFQFLAFFALVYALYLSLDFKNQNRLLLAASIFFYGCWDWRFLSLIFFSLTVDFFCSLAIEAAREKSRKRFFLVLSAASNFGLLGFFKYFNFFAENFSRFTAGFGWNPGAVTLHILLPVGISFYTFQSMSYTIDVYRGEQKAVRRYEDLALFVFYFPLLLAGPIERARHLLPQLTRPRKIMPEALFEGSWLVLRGVFKKVFIADNLARLVSPIFMKQTPAAGFEVLFGIYAFAFQIYGDFSGYSDIARGLARLMGIEVMENFRFPYFVTNPRDFWKNWHISLSTWLRDYLYIPLGGNRQGTLKSARNLMLTMLLGGLWHGASWTFVLWGGYHGLLLAGQRVYDRVRPVRGRISAPPRSLSFLKMIGMFHLTCLGWLLFRADSAHQVLSLLSACFHGPLLSSQAAVLLKRILQIIWPLLAMEVYQYFKRDTLAEFRLPVVFRAIIYLTLFYAVILFGGAGQEFIYFQF